MGSAFGRGGRRGKGAEREIEMGREGNRRGGRKEWEDRADEGEKV